jgi:hypothetical protein
LKSKSSGAFDGLGVLELRGVPFFEMTVGDGDGPVSMTYPSHEVALLDRQICVGPSANSWKIIDVRSMMMISV